MTIDDHDLYYGAPLKQIADHKLFKSINAEWQSNEKSRCAYRINTDIGVYIRAATKPVSGEYVFNFKKENIEEVKALEQTCKGKVFVVLVCYNAKAISKGSRMAHYRQICVLRPPQIDALIATKGAAADAQHNILIGVPSSKSMRAAAGLGITRSHFMTVTARHPLE